MQATRGPGVSRTMRTRPDACQGSRQRVAGALLSAELKALQDSPGGVVCRTVLRRKPLLCWKDYGLVSLSLRGKQWEGWVESAQELFWQGALLLTGFLLRLRLQSSL